MWKYLIFFLVTTTLASGEDDENFKFSTRQLEVKPNEEVHLDCGIVGEYRYCVWEHGNDIFQVEEVLEDKVPGKSKPWKWTAQENQCGIVIDRVTNQDFGKWTCKIFILGGSHVGSKDVVRKYDTPKVTTVRTTKYPVTSTQIKGTTTPKVGAQVEESGMSGGAIVLIVFLCLILVAVPVVVTMYLKKKEKLCFVYREVPNKSDTV